MKIVLNNGTEMNPIVVSGCPRHVQGANRDTLTFVFPASEGMEHLDGLFTPTNCETIVVREDNGSEFFHKGYTIRAELSKQSVEVAPATEEAEAVYEDRIMVSMSQRTYMESQIKNMEAAMSALLNGEV